MGVHGSDNKEVPNWKMRFNEESGVKSSPTEELDNSMKVEDSRALKHWRRVSSNSSSCFTILAIDPAFLQ